MNNMKIIWKVIQVYCNLIILTLFLASKMIFSISYLMLYFSESFNSNTSANTFAFHKKMIADHFERFIRDNKIEASFHPFKCHQAINTRLWWSLLDGLDRALLGQQKFLFQFSNFKWCGPLDLKSVNILVKQ